MAKETMKGFLENHNISIEDASVTTGISVSVIKRVSQGKINISRKTKEAFKNAYDVDIIIEQPIELNNKIEGESEGMTNNIINLKKQFETNVLNIQYEIEKLKKQAEVNETKAKLASVLDQNDTFFTRGDVIKEIEKLILLITTEKVEKENEFSTPNHKDILENNIELNNSKSKDEKNSEVKAEESEEDVKNDENKEFGYPEIDEDLISDDSPEESYDNFLLNEEENNNEVEDENEDEDWEEEFLVEYNTTEEI